MYLPIQIKLIEIRVRQNRRKRWLQRMRMDTEREQSVFPEEDQNADGGPGSGNWGHSGRPGKIGGSAKGTGSVEHRIQKRNGTFTSYAKRRTKLAKPHTLTKTEVEKCPAGSVIIGAKIKLKKAESGKKYVDTSSGKEYTFKDVMSLPGEHKLIMPKRASAKNAETSTSKSGERKTSSSRKKTKNESSSGGETNEKGSRAKTTPGAGNYWVTGDTSNATDVLKKLPEGTKVVFENYWGRDGHDIVSLGDGRFKEGNNELSSEELASSIQNGLTPSKIGTHPRVVISQNGEVVGIFDRTNSGGESNGNGNNGKTKYGIGKFPITGYSTMDVETLKRLPEGAKVRIEDMYNDCVDEYTSLGGGYFGLDTKEPDAEAVARTIDHRLSDYEKKHPNAKVIISLNGEVLGGYERSTKANGFPSLTGSEKQIAWANSIRKKKVKELLSYRKEAKEIPDSLGKFDRAMEKFLGSKTSSSWWIDNRFSEDNVKKAFAPILYAEVNG